MLMRSNQKLHFMLGYLWLNLFGIILFTPINKLKQISIKEIVRENIFVRMGFYYPKCNLLKAFGNSRSSNEVWMYGTKAPKLINGNAKSICPDWRLFLD